MGGVFHYSDDTQVFVNIKPFLEKPSGVAVLVMFHQGSSALVVSTVTAAVTVSPFTIRHQALALCPCCRTPVCITHQ